MAHRNHCLGFLASASVELALAATRIAALGLALQHTLGSAVFELATDVVEVLARIRAQATLDLLPYLFQTIVDAK